jgi:tetratricopeptide (TPR) repeat protein
MTAESALKPMTGTSLEVKRLAPSCIEIGLQASRKGNFQLARQMLHTAMEQLEGQEDKKPRLIELIINIADTYFNEGSYDQAKAWYGKALQSSELWQGTNTIQSACLIARLAELSVLQADMSEFEKCFENVQRTFLLSQESNVSALLGALIDLSWALCVQGRLAEVQPVNSLIAHIKQLEEEDRLGLAISVA